MNVFSRFFVINLALILVGTAAAGSVDRIDLADDWESDASIARRADVPIMVVFGTNDCQYCDRLRDQVLIPLLKTGTLAGKVLIREFNIDRGGKIVDFDGEPVRTRIFLERYDIYATPTVLLVDYQGEPLTSPIVGYNEQVTYTEQLDDTIDDAKMILVALGGSRFSATHQHQTESHHSLAANFSE